MAAAAKPEPGAEPDPAAKPDPGADAAPAHALPALPPKLVAIAYVIALVCVVAPPAMLGAGFAGGVLIRRGRPGSGLGVIAAAVLCSVLGFLLRS